MSMLGMIQDFIGQVSGVVNNRDNVLQLSSQQVDEINQILMLIKNIISDGIQRGDVQKMITLLGEIAEVIPELQTEIKAIVKGLKALFKTLFETDDFNLSAPPKQHLQMESSILEVQEIGERGMLSDVEIIEQLKPETKRPDEILVDQSILDDTFEKRLTIAEEILNIVNNHLVLAQPNIEALTKHMSAINRRSKQFNQTMDQ